VNIFGGLTRCDMIAEGIILAFRDLKMSVPVVVRLRGTNEESGQRIVCTFSFPPVSTGSGLFGDGNQGADLACIADR
jgi:succinyl-CoA synthetase beta subunit